MAGGTNDIHVVRMWFYGDSYIVIGSEVRDALEMTKSQGNYKIDVFHTVG